MTKISLLPVAMLVIISLGYGQEYKVSRSTGRLDIAEVNRVSIEGYSGNEIVFSTRARPRENDQRAEGLRALSSLGLEDNTGLGLSVVEKDGSIIVRQLKKTDGPEIKIMVPKGVVVSYSHSSPYGNDIKVTNFAGGLEISTVHNSVMLTNNSGPLKVRTVHGGIEAKFDADPKADITLESVHGHVDVAIPVTTKANLEMDTQWGEVLVDPDFKIELQRTGDLASYSGKIKGKMNAGGVNIALSSQHNNVYLRKK